MNNRQRQDIAKMSDIQLNEAIDRAYARVEKVGKHMTSVRIGLNKKLSALLDERFSRDIDLEG